ncbi:MAG: methyltransferase domain-containing protein [Chloroflexota bacterium]|nr:methyltransferase domain-containing protein [Chloroflexota bacterium]
MSNVERYYDADAQKEWDRLDRDRVEFAVTLRALDEYLPPAPARVLDIGSGPGRYAIELTRRGYQVTLADISEAELALAREKATEAGVTLSAVTKADARDLRQFEDGGFDAVLLMGPLYHLLEESDRRRAVDEAVRVVRTDGIVMATNITRYAAIRFWAKHAPMQVVERRAVYDQQAATGKTPNAVGFTDLYLMRPAELAALFNGTGVVHIVTIACEGVVSMIREKLDELDGEPWDYWVDLNYRLGKDPDTHGLAEHLLYVGRKTSPRTVGQVSDAL